MIRILIVEDEPPIARAVKQMIETSSNAFEVVGCEINGQTALLRMEEEEVDVVITDIRMPVMDGLEFLERAIVMNPNCLSVVLSGHQDFTYAQTALRLGAFDYLLKPLAPDKLKHLLNRLEEAFSKNALQSNRGKWDVSTFQSAMTSGNTDCWVVLANAGSWPLIPDDTLVPGAAFWKKHSPKKLIRYFMQQQEEVLVLEGKVSTECVFILKNIKEDRVKLLVQKLYIELTNLTALPITIYCADSPVVFWETGHLVRAMRSKLYNNIKLCTGGLLLDFEVKEKSDVKLTDLPTFDVVGALCINNYKMLNEALSTTIDSAIEKGITQQEFLRFLDIVINDERLIAQSTANLKFELSEAISNAVNAEGLKEDLAQILNQFNLVESKTDKKELILQIENYLIENYTKSISNELLSELFGFVPSYISKIFRGQTGMSPSEYLTKLRIEKAKSLLDEQQDLLVREVGVLVGYNDPYYFSKAFRKITGLWPTQYQSTYRKTDT